ncbi:helitron helicase-like domain-containing protein [Artemisia annua]|uniref:Helitron helicase-like domain-containing protein n=1 Tax=Artemisia annua TaxID=35608 RepID=A0A2U1PCK4_ARTAN|nr:helitron helicase-like domain-containing protein [Artemisia annua]
MPRKQNSSYGHRNAKYRNKVTQKGPQTTSVPFGPEIPNIQNQNPFANTHTTLSQKNPKTSSLPFGSQAPNVQNQNLFANTQSPLSACNAAMVDFSAQTVLPIEAQRKSNHGTYKANVWFSPTATPFLKPRPIFSLDKCNSFLQSRIAWQEKQTRQKRKKNSSLDEGPSTQVQKQCTKKDTQHHCQTSLDVTCHTELSNPETSNEGPSTQMQSQRRRQTSRDVTCQTHSDNIQTTNEGPSTRGRKQSTQKNTHRRGHTSRNVTCQRGLQSIQGNNEDAHNELVQTLRTARDLCNQAEIPDFKLRLYNAGRARGYELPTSDNVAAIVFDSGPTTESDYDVIIQYKDGPPQRINKLHKSYMSLQFLLIFIYGQPGFHTKLTLRSADPNERPKRVSMNAFYTYQLHPRPDSYMADYPNLTAADRADVVCRVFEQKIKAFIKFLKKGRPFGTVTGGTPPPALELQTEEALQQKTSEETSAKPVKRPLFQQQPSNSKKQKGTQHIFH